MNSQILSSTPQDIQLKALQDFCQRTRAGYISYPVAWVILALVTNQTDQVFLTAHLVCLSSFALFRLFLNRLFSSPQNPLKIISRIRLLWTTTLLNAAYFAGLLAYMLTQNISPVGVAAIIIILACIAPSGALTFSIYKPLGDAFFAVMFVIPLSVYFVEGYPQPLAATLAILTGYIYISVTASRFHHDYWAYARLNHQLSEYASNLEQENRLDPLTGMHNRRHFDERLQVAWLRARRDQQSLCVIMIDIDHFKQINDRWGHPAGDQILVAIADIIHQTFNRATDTLARYGGEEFIILLENTSQPDCLKSAEKLRERIAVRRFATDATELYCTVSLGIASQIPNETLAPQDLIKRADMALYKAKGDGRNRVACY
ncbi:GGDEF domain-containing protein [Aliamphritea spongicola]|uniref:GGDEF domain-containing protein n=1 Tax=Aliamphritea spongicola TaxID=707589 RepID=UPI00196B9C8F|nr:GGDEF domain-containing protein [Aliamphritea spongicola]MBN3562238.1 GGDEF domain-containing protein [Aliamphritea spongicola]